MKQWRTGLRARMTGLERYVDTLVEKIDDLEFQIHDYQIALQALQTRMKSHSDYHAKYDSLAPPPVECCTQNAKQQPPSGLEPGGFCRG